MSNHTVNSYDRELSLLTEAIVNMGLLVKDLLILANKSLNDTKVSYVELAKGTDLKINNYDLEIEQQATNILALRQPMAIDLRQAISALKLAVIMERMGDLAKNITKRSIKINPNVCSNIFTDIDIMTSLIAKMLDDVLLAFKKNDDVLAHSIPAADEAVDKIYGELMDRLEIDMVANSCNIDSNIQIIFALKNIERIGDYVTKIARITHYIVTGERNFKNAKKY